MTGLIFTLLLLSNAWKTAAGGYGTSACDQLESFEKQADAGNEILTSRPNVSDLVRCLRDTDAERRTAAAIALRSIKPLPAQAVHALTMGLSDRNATVRSQAANTLLWAGVEQADNEGSYYGVDQIITAIPPDNSYKFPARLYSLQTFRDDSAFLITIHRGEARPDRLAFWKSARNGKYRRLQVMESNGPGGFGLTNELLLPVRGDTTGDQDWFYVAPVFLLGPQGPASDMLFAFDGKDRLRQVNTERADQWVQPHLRPGEEIREPSADFITGDKLQFHLNIWRAQDPLCRPTGGRVSGTYGILREDTFDQSKQEWITNWKMVVDSAVRAPIDQHNGVIASYKNYKNHLHNAGSSPIVIHLNTVGNPNATRTLPVR